MKRVILFFSLFLTLAAFAQNADTKEESNHQDRSLYMPDIITPQELKSGFYGGLGLAASTLTAHTIDKKIDNTMLDLAVVAGYNFNQYLSAETRAMVSMAYDKDVDFKSWGIFLKPKYDINKKLTFYSLIGYGGFDAKSVYSDKVKTEKNALQFGIGANYKLKDNFKIFADYTYLGKDAKGKYDNSAASFKSSAITTGITYDF